MVSLRYNRGTLKSTTPAIVDDLYRVREHGKAEIVDGELVLMSPTGARPSRAAGSVYASLRGHERTRGGGLAYPDNAAFIVDLPHRRSFSPDAAFHRGTQPTMKFVEGAPVFAVEVRSEGDYGPRAEKAVAEKRADYFAAGTEVFWDVDLLSEAVIRVHRIGQAEATIYRRGEMAEAEPGVPGWRFPVDELFE
jgi:Uma2 family endonuclease